VADKPDFRGIVAHLSEEQHVREQQRPQHETAERDERKHLAETGIRWLQENVQPLLVSARDALAEHGVLLEVSNSFEPAHLLIHRPSIAFRCASPARDDGFRLHCRFYAVDCDGKVFRTNQAMSPYSTSTDQHGVEVSIHAQHRQERVTALITDCIHDYYETVAPKVSWYPGSASGPGSGDNEQGNDRAQAKDRQDHPGHDPLGGSHGEARGTGSATR
jgi:hypothetical protein